jgi:hypothetical protein
MSETATINKVVELVSCCAPLVLNNDDDDDDDNGDLPER